MKISTPLILFLSFYFFIAKSQEPAMTLKSSLNKGSVVSFYVKAIANNTLIQVDFGDSIKIEKIVNNYSTQISGTLVDTSIIKIYGSGISYLDCSFLQLTDLDISNNTYLTELNCSYNQLRNLDLTANTPLLNLNCGGNQLTSIDVTKNTALEYFQCGGNQLSTLDISKN